VPITDAGAARKALSAVAAADSPASAGCSDPVVFQGLLVELLPGRGRWGGRSSAQAPPAARCCPRCWRVAPSGTFPGLGELLPVAVRPDVVTRVEVGYRCGDGVSLNGRAAAGIGVVRVEASDPRVSGTVDGLGIDAVKAVAGTDAAGTHARARAWRLAGWYAPDHGVVGGGPLVIDVDAVLATARDERGRGSLTVSCAARGSIRCARRATAAPAGRRGWRCHAEDGNCSPAAEVDRNVRPRRFESCWEGGCFGG
jgi:hypothetical protein